MDPRLRGDDRKENLGPRLCGGDKEERFLAELPPLA